MSDIEKIIIVTFPKVRYNTKVIEIYNNYCFYQYIKYAEWGINDIKTISNWDTAIERWERFLKDASTQVLNVLKFTTALGDTLNSIRTEPAEQYFEEEITQDNWMEIGSDCQETEIDTKFENLIDVNTNWELIRANYSNEELDRMINWIKKQKTSLNLPANETNTLPDVDPEQLNTLQRFTYDLVNVFKITSKQLLLILLGTAGTGKSFTVAAITKLYNGILKRACPTAKAAFLIDGNDK